MEINEGNFAVSESNMCFLTENANRSPNVQQPQRIPAELSVSPGPSSHPTTNVDRTVIWRGKLEWVKKLKANDPEAKQTLQVPCSVAATVKDGEAEVKADSWPEEFTMRLMRKAAIGNIGQAYLKNSRSVVFFPSKCEALDSLIKMMSNSFVACVYSKATSTCSMKALLLLYIVEKRTFLGFIPNDQSAFVDSLIKKITQKNDTVPNEKIQTKTTSFGRNVTLVHPPNIEISQSRKVIRKTNNSVMRENKNNQSNGNLNQRIPSATAQTSPMNSKLLMPAPVVIEPARVVTPKPHSSNAHFSLVGNVQAQELYFKQIELRLREAEKRKELETESGNEKKLPDDSTVELAKEIKKSNYLCTLLLQDIKMKLESHQSIHEPLELLADRLRQQSCVLDNVIDGKSINEQNETDSSISLDFKRKEQHVGFHGEVENHNNKKKKRDNGTYSEAIFNTNVTAEDSVSLNPRLESSMTGAIYPNENHGSQEKNSDVVFNTHMTAEQLVQSNPRFQFPMADATSSNLTYSSQDKNSVTAFPQISINDVMKQESFTYTEIPNEITNEIRSNVYVKEEFIVSDDKTEDLFEFLY